MMLSWLNGVTPAVPVTLMLPEPPHVMLRHWIGLKLVHENAAGATMHVLSIEMSHGEVHAMLPVSLTVGLLLALAEAEFGIDVHAVGDVSAVNTMVRTAPAI